MESILKRTWAEIDLDALAHNYKILRSRVDPRTLFLGVVKADAYGHGAVEVARALQELGSEYLAVSNIDEAHELRQAGIALPILQLGVTPADCTQAVLEDRVTQAVWSEDAARCFSDAALRAGERMKVHIKLDTGMSRLGFPCDEAHFDASLEALCRVCALPGLDVEGIFTHFAVSDEEDKENHDYTLLQHRRFDTMLRRLEERGVAFRLRHCSNSGAAAHYPQFAYDMLRPGILLYGASRLAPPLDLRPVMSLKTVVGAVQHLAPGSTVSYGRTFRTDRPTRIGILPIGYADGLHRSLSNRWRVWTPHGTAPILGRICMDMCMVDLTDLPALSEGAEVEVYGPHNSVNDAADLAGTIPYELICAVSKRVPRVFWHTYFLERKVSKEL